MSDPSRVEAIFTEALGRAGPGERAAYLDEACRGELEVRRQVDRLLRAHAEGVGYLATPGPMAMPTVDLPGPVEGAGAVVGGRYKLLEPIGEGGMGSVWMAQQTEPVRRTVALKLIKAGMDTKAVLARFEAERQALALMDHPNIARVLDAGATAEGRPFFVMELVKGVPITRYCDEHKLTLRQRLDLFIPVCRAVQHAHQKGVIHRDLKPSNVLVARYDDKPVPKVIDFGIAKAAGQPLTDRTLVTGFGAVVGTPEYMSPEQAQFNQLDVDTRSDIYALGVLLYELLTGSTPVTRAELGKAGLIEVLRMIREAEPPRPSTRLSTAQGLPQIAANRGSEARALAGLLRNDLDWVVMKALEKDRNRRYETATGLAADIGRYLDGEPVLAHPPGAGYRLTKFSRKHRAAIVTAAAFLGLLIASAGVSTILALKARHAETVAESRRVEADARTKEAKDTALLNAQLAERLTEETLSTRQAAAGLQFELDLAEMKNDPRIGLLRMARNLKEIQKTLVEPLGGGPNPMTFSLDPARTAMDEFATLAILARGQEFAPLVPPLSDGGEMKSYHIGSKGRRVLTLEDDRTARLWDPFTARRIAVLQGGGSKVVEAGFSPDGLAAFTHSLDGVVRVWDAETGALRAETDPRPARIKVIQPDSAPADPVAGSYPYEPRATLQSNDRLLTLSESCTVSLNPEGGRNPSVPSRTGPVELWDASKGRLIARLEIPANTRGDFEFTKDGRWIVVSDPDFVHVWSASDGLAVARLPLGSDPSMPAERPVFAASGRTMATLLRVRDGSGEFAVFVHLWETSSWKRLSMTGPFSSDGGSFRAFFSLIDDHRFRTGHGMETRIYQAGNTTPIAVCPGYLNEIAGNRAWFAPEIVVDTSTWQRLRPPPGRKYHPDLARFSADGRFLPNFRGMDEVVLVDMMTEKTLELPRISGLWKHQAGLGWIAAWIFNDRTAPLRLTPPDHLNIPPDLLELWLKVAIRGELDADGTFLKWDEPTWEKRRLELATMPAPYTDFPFPGRVAHDRSHWLREEYERTGKLPTLARQLLDRADAVGDRAEADHWRKLLASKPVPAGPPASK